MLGIEIQTINGGDGDDHLIVDFTEGDAVPSGGLTFNGGVAETTAGDSLDVIAPIVGFTTQTFNYFQPGLEGNNGSIQIDSSATINYTGLEPIHAGNAANTILNLPAVVANDATLQNNAAAGSIEIIDNGATFENTVIPNPTVSLTVNLAQSATR